ncbi:MAG: DUF1294 domain-containing protein [Clostridia bacterium]|nr:DUF1294 domain-containing protein [Clostridia bacterium]
MMPLYIFLIVMNVTSFFAFGIDKLLSKSGARRISEKTLLILSTFGGSFGALIGMVLFNHKTSKAKFRYTVPFLFILYAIILLYK